MNNNQKKYKMKYNQSMKNFYKNFKMNKFNKINK